MSEAQGEIVITAMGLVGCLAVDAANACAAARAGLSRASELPFVVVDDETGEPAAVVGYAIAGMSDGFEGTGRVARVLQLALADLRRGLPEPDPTASARCGWVLALPAWITPDEPEDRPTYTLRQAPPAVPAAVRDVIRVGLDGAGFTVDDRQLSVHPGDHTSFGRAVAEALARMRAGELDACVVGAADTLVDSAVLETLMADGRLKTPNEPLGVAPGEGGALFLFEKGDAARRRGAGVMGVLTGVAMGVDEDTIAERAPGGRALAGLTASLCDVSRLSSPPLLVSDYNGEGHRSAEYGHVLFQLGALNPVFQTSRTWFPAASFGDTGAASAAIGLGMVLRGFARGYAGANEAVLLSSSASEARSVIGVRSAN